MSATTSGRQQFKDKLRAALDRNPVGISDLARRMSGDQYEFEAERRAIHKHLKGEAVPRREVRRGYEIALGLELGELEPDDEEGESAMSLDDFMRLRARQILDEEREASDRKATTRPLTLLGSADGSQRIGGYTHDRDPDAR